MPCTKCSADFNFFTWKLKCLECEHNYCSKCLKKQHGYYLCEKCCVLEKRPPDLERLMRLRAKDLQEYLNRHHVSTHGLVEKSELVELFYRRPIPVRHKRSHGHLPSVFSGSVPNLTTHPQEHIQNIRTNINSMRSYAENAIHNIARNVGPTGSRSSNTSPTHTESSDMPDISTPRPTTSSDNPDNLNMPSAPLEENDQSPTPSPRKYPKLSDYETADELGELSVKQLKELLALNRVDYKGCVEKNELLDRATRLWEDAARGKIDELGDNLDNVCKICMDAPLECVILECGHVATCVNCGKRLAECPICRQYVTRVVRTFKA